MSVKLRFRVVHFSSEDDGYPAEELNVHSPSTKGWQSARFCDYPQEIGIEILGGETRLSQVQILSHQSKIATKVEIFVGKGPDYHSAAYRRLGYLTLDSNERSSYQARELKTVYVDHIGKFIRLLVHKNYVNRQNLFNQVGIVAVNLLGGEGSPAGGASRGDKAIPSFNSPLNDLSIDMNLDPQTAVKLRQLVEAKARAVASEDYVTAKRIKEVEGELKSLGTQLAQLDIAKKRAVADEEYDRAKELKDEGDSLRAEIESKIMAVRIPGVTDARQAPSGQVMRAAPKAAQHQQQLAADYEDAPGGYSEAPYAPPPRVSAVAGAGGRRAAAEPMNIDDLPVGGGRGRGGMAAEPHALAGAKDYPLSSQPYSQDGEGNGPRGRGDIDSLHVAGGSPSKRAADNGAVMGAGSPVPVRSEMFSPGGGDRPIRPKPTTTYDDNDPYLGDEVAGIGAGSDGLSLERFPPGQHPLEGVHNVAELPAPEGLAGKAREVAEQGGITALIGEYRARCLFSKTWGLRDAVMTKVLLMLTGYADVDEEEASGPSFEENPGIVACLPALAQIVRVGVEDKIQQVLYGAVALLEALLAASRRAKISRSTLVPLLDPTIVCLVEKLGDGNARIREGAHKGLECLASSGNVGPSVIAAHISRPLSSKQATAWRPISERLQLLTDLVGTYGLGGNTSLSVEGVMGFAKANGAFSHSNGEVRDAARNLTVRVQKLVGTQAIQAYLNDLRKKQLDEYLAAFEGVPASNVAAAAQRRGSTEAASGAAGQSGASSKSSGKGNTPAVRAADKEGPPSSSPKRVAEGGRGGGGTKSTGHNNDDDVALATEDVADFTTCMFCGQSDEGWNEDRLDLHYWKDCPLLSPCPACAQVVEIAGLPEHLLEECEHKAEYIPCDVTGLAIRATEMGAWQNSPSCVPAPSNCMYCPLCLLTVVDSNEDWNQHLINNCPKNERTRRK